MTLEIIQNTEQWKEIRADWDRMAKHNPMMCFDWMFGWWAAYGAGCRLRIIVVRDSNNTIVAIAPLYEHAPNGASSLRFLASGAVCSDYLEIMIEPTQRTEVAPILAEYIRKSYGQFSSNTLSQGVFLEGVKVASQSHAQFYDSMKDQGFFIKSAELESGWRIALPESWEQYVSHLGGFRRKARKAIKTINSGAVQVRELNDARYADQGLAILKTLHVMRRAACGDRGCFGDIRFEKFLHNAIPPMLDSGKAKIVWIEAEGRPISILLSLMGDNWIAQYQSGMNPDLASLEPGHISVTHGIHQAIEQGYAEYDFLRGNESYKPHWSAVPVRMEKAWLIPPTICARASYAFKEKVISWRNYCRSTFAATQELA